MAIDFSDLGGQAIEEPKKRIDFSDLGGEPIQDNGQQSTFDRANNSFPGVRKAIQYGIDTLNAPFELAGESMRTAAEGLAGRSTKFRPPTIAQNLGMADRTSEPPANPFTLTNKLVRTGAAYGAGALTPGRNAMQQGQAEYDRAQSGVDTAADLALGLGAGAVAPEVANAPLEATVQGAKSIFSGAKRTTSLFGKKMLSAALGPTEEAINARLTRPEALRTSSSEASLASDVETGYRTVQGKIKGIEKNVSKVLRKSPYLEEGATPKDDILSILDKTRKKIGMTVTPNEQYAKSILDNISENLSKTHETVSESQLRDIVQKITQATEYGKKEYGTTDISLMRTRHEFDQLLKRNEQYRNYMLEEAPLQRLKRNVANQFSLKRGEVGEGLVATDATAGKLKSIFGESKRVQSRKTLEGLQKVTGKDYVQGMKDYQLAKQFEPGATNPNGSRRTAFGGVVGAAVGKLFGSPVIGSAVGAGTGFYLDKQGGAVAAKLIDLYNSARGAELGNFAPLVQKYGPALEEASHRGGAALSTLDEHLKANDPDYATLATQLEVIQNSSEKPKPKPGLFKKSAKAKVLDEKRALAFLDQTNGDKEKARELAKAQGYEIPIG
jgi:hypothetical protein